MDIEGGLINFKLKRVKGEKCIELVFPNDSWLRNKINFYAVPRKRGEYDELLLSCVNPNKWNNIWELKFTIEQDMPGIILSITQSIRDSSANILKHEGYTPHEEIEYSFWILIDATKFIGNHDLGKANTEEVRIKLVEEIQSRINRSEYINNQECGIKVMEASKIELFEENHIENLDAKINSMRKSVLTEFFDEPIQFVVKNNKAFLPIARLFEALKIDYFDEHYIYGTIFSDFSQKNYYIIKFFKPDQRVLYFDIRHKHEIGSINKLSRIVFNGDFNVFYNRATIKQDTWGENGEGKGYSHWYVLMEAPIGSNCNELLNKLIESPLTDDVEPVRIFNYTKPLAEDKNFAFKKKVPQKANWKLYLQFFCLFFLVMVATVLFLFFLFYFSNNKEAQINNSVIAFIAICCTLIIYINGIWGGIGKLKRVIEDIRNQN